MVLNLETALFWVDVRDSQDPREVELQPRATERADLSQVGGNKCADTVPVR